MIENSSKAPLNFSPLKYTHLGKNSIKKFNIICTKSEKMIIEKWPLRTSFQCIPKIGLNLKDNKKYQRAQYNLAVLIANS